MQEFWNRSKSQALVYKLAIAFLVFYSLDSICTAIVSVMMDVDWGDLTHTEKLIKGCLVMKAWASTMLAFFTNISKKAAANELPFQTDPTTGSTNQPKQNEEQNTSAVPVSPVSVQYVGPGSALNK